MPRTIEQLQQGYQNYLKNLRSDQCKQAIENYLRVERTSLKNEWEFEGTYKLNEIGVFFSQATGDAISYHRADHISKQPFDTRLGMIPSNLVAHELAGRVAAVFSMVQPHEFVDEDIFKPALWDADGHSNYWLRATDFGADASKIMANVGVFKYMIAKAEGKERYTHCKAGRGRAPMFASAAEVVYLKHATGQSEATVQQALTAFAAERKQLDPSSDQVKAAEDIVEAFDSFYGGDHASLEGNSVTYRKNNVTSPAFVMAEVLQLPEIKSMVLRRQILANNGQENDSLNTFFSTIQRCEQDWYDDLTRDMGATNFKAPAVKVYRREHPLEAQLLLMQMNRLMGEDINEKAYKQLAFLVAVKDAIMFYQFYKGRLKDLAPKAGGPANSTKTFIDNFKALCDKHKKETPALDQLHKNVIELIQTQVNAAYKETKGFTNDVFTDKRFFCKHLLPVVQAFARGANKDKAADLKFATLEMDIADKVIARLWQRSDVYNELVEDYQAALLIIRPDLKIALDVNSNGLPLETGAAAGSSSNFRM